MEFLIQQHSVLAKVLLNILTSSILHLGNQRCKIISGQCSEVNNCYWFCQCWVEHHSWPVTCFILNFVFRVFLPFFPFFLTFAACLRPAWKKRNINKNNNKKWPHHPYTYEHTSVCSWYNKYNYIIDYNNILYIYIMYVKTIIVSTLAVNQIHHQCCNYVSTMWVDITKHHLQNLCRDWYVGVVLCYTLKNIRVVLTKFGYLSCNSGLCGLSWVPK